MEISLIDSRMYSQPETYTQKTGVVFLGLIVSGLQYMKIYDPAGQLYGSAGNRTLTLIPENFRLEFAFDSDRENYVTLCRIEGLNWDSAARRLLLDNGEAAFAVPLVMPVIAERLVCLRDIFRRTERLMGSSTKSDLFAAQLLMSSVVAEFICETKTRNVPEPLKMFMQSIDADISFSNSISEHAGKVGFSVTHLRRLFLKHYQTEISEYRSRLRFNRIVTLMEDRNLSLKEIADKVGMCNVTHLHLFIRKNCGMTPGQLRHNLSR